MSSREPDGNSFSDIFECCCSAHIEGKDGDDSVVGLKDNTCTPHLQDPAYMRLIYSYHGAGTEVQIRDLHATQWGIVSRPKKLPPLYA